MSPPCDPRRCAHNGGGMSVGQTRRKMLRATLTGGGGAIAFGITRTADPAQAASQPKTQTPWGITKDGAPYFRPAGAAPGEEGALRVSSDGSWRIVRVKTR